MKNIINLDCNCLDHINQDCAYHTALRKHNESVKGEMADGQGWGMSISRGFTKKMKNSYERRRAKVDPECTPGYKKYAGWLT